MRCATLLLVLLAWVLPAETAWADPLDGTQRARVEVAALEGRWGDLEREAAATPTEIEDLLPFALRDLWWRAPSDPKRAPYAQAVADAPDADAVAVRRLAWLLADPDTRGAWPTGGHPHVDPWPFLDVLVRDRLWRTSGAWMQGANGPVARFLLEHSGGGDPGAEDEPPYWAYRVHVLDQVANEASLVREGGTLTSDDAKERAADLASRNRWWALLVLLALVGIPWFLSRLPSERRGT